VSVTELPERAPLRAVPTSVPDGILSFSAPCAAVAKAYVAAKGKIGRIVADQTGNVKTEKANYSYKYADLAGVIAAVSPAFQENGLAVLQGVSTDTRPDHLTVETMLLHESGEWIRSSLSMRPTQSTPQGLGSTITYARRYALLAMAGVAPEEDDDGAKGSHGCGHDEQQIAQDAQRRQAVAARIGALLAKRMGEGLTGDGVIELCRTITDGKVAEWMTLDSLGGLQAFFAAVKAWKPAQEAAPTTAADPAAADERPAPTAAKDRKALVAEVLVLNGIPAPKRGQTLNADSTLAIQSELQRVLGLETQKALRDFTDAELAAYLALKASEQTPAVQTDGQSQTTASETSSGRVSLPAGAVAEMEALVAKSGQDEAYLQELAGWASASSELGVTYEWRMLTVDEALAFRGELLKGEN